MKLVRKKRFFTLSYLIKTFLAPLVKRRVRQLLQRVDTLEQELKKERFSMNRLLVSKRDIGQVRQHNEDHC